MNARFSTTAALFLFLVIICSSGLLANSSPPPVYTFNVNPDDLLLKRRATAELRATGQGLQRPLSIAFERTGGSTGQPVLTATLLTGSCSPDSSDRTGCDSLMIDFSTGKLEFRSFSRRKGIVALLDGIASLWNTSGPIRLTSRKSRALPILSIAVSSPASRAAPQRVNFEARVNDRRYGLAVDFTVRRSPVTLLPLLALFKQVIEAESRAGGVTPRSTNEQVDTSPGGLGSGGGSCSLCDFCSSLPGGNTVGGCLGSSGGGSGGANPGAVPAPPPSSPCPVANDQALETFGNVLWLELAMMSLCSNSMAALVPYIDLFDTETDLFKTKRDSVADPISKACADCFFQVNRRYGIRFGGTGMAALKSILSPKCIRTYSDLLAPANAPQLTLMKSVARQYMDSLANCKKRCDSSTAPAPHRAYCDCLPKYLLWEPAGPRPGSVTCPP